MELFDDTIVLLETEFLKCVTIKEVKEKYMNLQNTINELCQNRICQIDK